MNVIEKDHLIIEAKMQTAALKKINVWKKLAIVVSTIGVAVTYAGFSGTPSRLFPCILGILLIVMGFAVAALLNLGLKNGRRNVEKMIWALDEVRKLPESRTGVNDKEHSYS